MIQQCLPQKTLPALQLWTQKVINQLPLPTFNLVAPCRRSWSPGSRGSPAAPARCGWCTFGRPCWTRRPRRGRCWRWTRISLRWRDRGGRKIEVPGEKRKVEDVEVFVLKKSRLLFGGWELKSVLLRQIYVGKLNLFVVATGWYLNNYSTIISCCVDSDAELAWHQ